MFARLAHPALVMLVRINIRSKFRRLRQAIRTTKGIIAAVFVVGLVAMMVVPNLVMGIAGQPSNPQIARSAIPIGLLAICLLNLLMTKPDSGVVFFPAEVDFLFPAPFRRSELLLYKIIGMLITSLCLGLFFSLIAFRHISM